MVRPPSCREDFTPAFDQVANDVWLGLYLVIINARDDAQSRALLVWTRLIMPNGRSIVLERQPGADASGYAGLEDEVDNHWGQILRAAFISTLLSVGSQAGAGDDEDQLVQALRSGSSDGVSQVGRQLVGRSLDIRPTITIRPGFPVRVIITRDIVLEPWRG